MHYWFLSETSERVRQQRVGESQNACLQQTRLLSYTNISQFEVMTFFFLKSKCLFEFRYKEQFFII